MTQKEINQLILNKISDTIDQYNKITSPYTITLFKKVKGNNWTITETQYDYQTRNQYHKQTLTNNDTLKIRIDPITQLKYKNINNITVKFKTEIKNNNTIPYINNITAKIFDNEYPIQINEPIQIENTIDCGLFDNTELTNEIIYNAIQNNQFWIHINFNGNNSNCEILITDLQVNISFTNDLNNEKEAIYNRLETIFDDIDLNITEINRTIHPEDYPKLTIDTNTYEKDRNNIIKGTLTLKDQPIPQAIITYYINDQKIDTTITNDKGEYIIPIENIQNDFKIKTEYKGNSQINTTTTTKTIKVTKYKPQINITTKEEYYYNETTKEPINITINTDLINKYPTNITINLLNNNNQVINTQTINTDTNTTTEFTNYETNDNKPVIIEIKTQETPKYEPTTTTQPITLTYKEQITTKTPTIQIITKNPKYNDNLTIKTTYETTPITEGTLTIKINNKTLTNQPINQQGNTTTKLNTQNYNITNTNKDITYKYEITYNGTNNYMTTTISGTITIQAPKTQTIKPTKITTTNNNKPSKPYQKWHTLKQGTEQLCICGKNNNIINLIGGSNGTYNTPLPIILTGISAKNTDITITKIQITYQDANYPPNDNQSTNNSPNIAIPKKQTQITIKGEIITKTDHKRIGNKRYITHTHTITGKWTEKDLNEMKIRINYAKNTNTNPGRLKFKNPKIIITYTQN